MLEGDPSLFSTEKNQQVVPSVTINQFFQLVNQPSNFPDAATLDRYSPEDKAWIKQRVELEQENRHQVLNKLVANEHQFNLAASHQAHRSEI